MGEGGENENKKRQKRRKKERKNERKLIPRASIKKMARQSISLIISRKKGTGPICILLPHFPDPDADGAAKLIFKRDSERPMSEECAINCKPYAHLETNQETAPINFHRDIYRHVILLGLIRREDSSWRSNEISRDQILSSDFPSRRLDHRD